MISSSFMENWYHRMHACSLLVTAVQLVPHNNKTFILFVGFRIVVVDVAIYAIITSIFRFQLKSNSVVRARIFHYHRHQPSLDECSTTEIEIWYLDILIWDVWVRGYCLAYHQHKLMNALKTRKIMNLNIPRHKLRRYTHMHNEYYIDRTIQYHQPPSNWNCVQIVCNAFLLRQ